MLPKTAGLELVKLRTKNVFRFAPRKRTFICAFLEAIHRADAPRDVDAWSWHRVTTSSDLDAPAAERASPARDAAVA
jgi:hypothetical protein